MKTGAGGRIFSAEMTPNRPLPAVRPFQVPARRIAGAALMLASLGLVSVLTLVQAIIRIFH